jgi:AcrR family transcriptional regulator
MSQKQSIRTDKMVKVDPRIRRTRQMLQQAMRDLLKEKDFLDINVLDIAEHAGLNRATFYKHFTDKYDLLNTFNRERFQMHLEATLPENPGLSAETVGILIQATYDYLENFHSDCLKARPYNEQTLTLHSMQHQIYENLLTWLQNGEAKDSGRDQALEMIALLASWAIFGPTFQVTWGIVQAPKQDLIRQVTAVVYSILNPYLFAA